MIKELNCKFTALPWTVFYIGRYISQVILSFLRCDSCWKHLNFGMYCPKYCENSLGKMQSSLAIKIGCEKYFKMFFFFLLFCIFFIMKTKRNKIKGWESEGWQADRQAGRWKISPLTWKRTCSENIGMELNIKKMQKNDFFGVIWKIFL